MAGGTAIGTFGYDGNGNATTYRGTSIGYDGSNNPVRFGELTAATMVAGYTSGGMRAWKQGAGGRTYFLYDGAAPVIEMDSTGATTATNTFGAAGLISRKVTGSPSGTTFYTFDERGNTVR